MISELAVARVDIALEDRINREGGNAMPEFEPNARSIRGNSETLPRAFASRSRLVTLARASLTLHYAEEGFRRRIAMVRDARSDCLIS